MYIVKILFVVLDTNIMDSISCNYYTARTAESAFNATLKKITDKYHSVSIRTACVKRVTPYMKNDEADIFYIDENGEEQRAVPGGFRHG